MNIYSTQSIKRHERLKWLEIGTEESLREVLKNISLSLVYRWEFINEIFKKQIFLHPIYGILTYTLCSGFGKSRVFYIIGGYRYPY